MIKIKFFMPFLLFLVLTVFGNYAIAQKKTSKKMEITSAMEMNFSEGKWKEIATMAKKSNKYIFVDAYATWCGPCKLLKSQTFKEKEVISFFNENFINVTMDMEKGEGDALATEWQIEAYPTLLFFNPNGQLIMREIGFLNGKDLLEIGKQALKKM